LLAAHVSIDVFNATGDDVNMPIKNTIKIELCWLSMVAILIFSTTVNAIDTSAEETVCQSIGFKKKTDSFANCVLELLDRRASSNSISNSNDPDDSTCRKYGFRPRSNEYATCRLQIDQARQDAQRQQAQYNEQQRQYQAQLDEQKKQRNQAQGMALMQMGAGISSGAYNARNGYGTLPNPPALLDSPRTYILPGGKAMTCSTTGSVTNCF
jgi:hypothetical protein